MTKSWPLIGLALLIILPGCQPKPDQKLNYRTDDSSSNSQSQTPTPKRPDEKTPEELQKEIDERDAKIRAEHAKVFAIKPGEQIGYKPTPEAPQKTLGQKIDEGIANTDPTFAQVRVEMNVRDNVVTARPLIIIKDQSNYKIEFIDPQHPKTISSVIANNGKHVSYIDNKVKDMPKPNNQNQQMTAAQVETWLDNIQLHTFDSIYKGTKPWQSVISTLKDPQSGYTTTVEEKSEIVAGKDRPFYRIVAKSKNRELELVFDAIRFLPLTIRNHKKNADGTSEQLYWAAQWAFGGEFSKNDFNIPGQS